MHDICRYILPILGLKLQKAAVKHVFRALYVIKAANPCLYYIFEILRHVVRLLISHSLLGLYFLGSEIF